MIFDEYGVNLEPDFGFKILGLYFQYKHKCFFRVSCLSGSMYSTVFEIDIEG